MCPAPPIDVLCATEGIIGLPTQLIVARDESFADHTFKCYFCVNKMSISSDYCKHKVVTILEIHYFL